MRRLLQPLAGYTHSGIGSLPSPPRRGYHGDLLASALRTLGELDADMKVQQTAIRLRGGCRGGGCRRLEEGFQIQCLKRSPRTHRGARPATTGANTWRDRRRPRDDLSHAYYGSRRYVLIILNVRAFVSHQQSIKVQIEHNELH